MIDWILDQKNLIIPTPLVQTELEMGMEGLDLTNSFPEEIFLKGSYPADRVNNSKEIKSLTLNEFILGDNPYYDAEIEEFQEIGDLEVIFDWRDIQYVEMNDLEFNDIFTPCSKILRNTFPVGEEKTVEVNTLDLSLIHISEPTRPY